MQTERRTHLSLKERQRQEREVLILKAAEEVLLEKGYYDTSMEEIAAHVGIAKGTVYLHFPGKEELVIAILERNIQSFLQEIDAIVASSNYETPRAKLEAILHFMHTGLFSRHSQLLSTIYNGVDLKRKITEKGCFVHELWESMVQRVTLILEEGKVTGDFDSSIPTQVMVMTIFSIFSPRSYQQLLIGDDVSLDDLARHLIRVCFDGITVHKTV
ncbi:MAG: TetR/AcrR family transcriptional regulator [Ktedonobacteraceae bacterium]